MALSFWAFEVKTISVNIVSFPFCHTKVLCHCKMHFYSCENFQFTKARCFSKGVLLITKSKTHDGSLKDELFVLVLKFLLITLNLGFLVEHLILMVGLLQISLLVDAFLLIMPLVSCMLSIKLGFLLL